MRMDAFMYSKHKIEGMHERLHVNVKVELLFNPRGGGNFWVGMCRWDPGTINLYKRAPPPPPPPGV